MSNPVASALSAPITPETSAPQVENSQENADIEASEGENSEESGQNEGSEAKPVKKEEKKAKEIEKRIKKLKLKVDNKEYEEEIDLDDDEALIRHLQLGKMGQKRAQEKAELEKQFQQFFTALQQDPLSLLSQDFGMDTNKMIDDYINKQMEQAKKSPEQLERERLEVELHRLRQERESEKEVSKAKELERLQNQAFQQYDMQMEQALSKTDLPKTPYTVKKIADYMLVALEAGHDVSPEDVIPLVREEMHSDLKEMFNSLPEDQVEALLGEQVLNKLRKRRVAKAQEAQKVVGKNSQIPDTGKSVKGLEKKPGEKKTFKDFFGV